MIPVVANSVADFACAEWNRLFPGELEDWSYYRATECAQLSGFTWRYFGVRVGGELRAVVPGFMTEYRLDTTLEGRLRTVAVSLARAVPSLLSLRMLSLGSPVGEACHIGFAPDSSPEERSRMVEIILDTWEAHAEQQGVRLLAVKDAGEAQAGLWGMASWEQAFTARGLRQQPGLPTARLDLPFATPDEYLATLSRATRKDLRRKLRAREALRIEWRSDLYGIRDAVARLYQNTLERAEMRFEELTADFFESVLRELDGRASCVCYWLDETLVAFNLVLHDSGRLIDKYIGMDYRHARRLNLYYVSWMENVRYAIEHRIPVYQSGQGLPREKLRLGSTLSPNWLWYRHRNRLIDTTMKAAEHAFGLHRPQSSADAPRREARA
ncbi:MAG TPA: GNAT family N-acetyltransferase [Xanthomonadaceae bacterium]|nr:GNAT family N-acetyltransferase [Xanthomonadaceae bacterium]